MNPLVVFGAFVAKLPAIGRVFSAGLLNWKYFSRRIMRRAHHNLVNPRNWSNEELRKIAPIATGDVINVSGWRDGDKQGGRYRDYFIKARSYTISNYPGENGLQGLPGEIELDLERGAPPELVGKFQVVFNHTVLEHVFEVHAALDTLCALSHDLLILITPFLQAEHYAEGSYGDWWRMSPQCVRRLLENRGFSTVYQSANDNAWDSIYVFTAATRYPDRYSGPRSIITHMIGNVSLERVTH